METIIISIVLVLVIALAVGSVIKIYNKLVKLRNRYKNSYAQIDVQLKRRYDLIPNLVEIAKKFMEHERGTLEGVTKARNTAYIASTKAANNPGDPDAMRELIQAESVFRGRMGGFFERAENYPALQANTNMMHLKEELTSTENKIAFARQAFNDAVTLYNTSREQFPSVVFANTFNFGAAMLFEIEEEQREGVRVSFD
ncbi:LemA family protein [Chitinispirillum alkaliphilum]|nr:LemA family protein [Chitinispirillum alkaliphilum]